MPITLEDIQRGRERRAAQDTANTPITLDDISRGRERRSGQVAQDTTRVAETPFLPSIRSEILGEAPREQRFPAASTGVDSPTVPTLPALGQAPQQVPPEAQELASTDVAGAFDVDIEGIGEQAPFLPASSTNVVVNEGPEIAASETEQFLGSLSSGLVEGFTGVELPEDIFGERQGFGFTVGQLLGFAGSFAGAGVGIKALRGIKALTPAFRKLSPFAQRMVQSTVAGGTVETFKQSNRGLVGQGFNPERIAETAVLFGGTEAALFGLGLFGKQIFGRNNPVTKRVIAGIVPGTGRVKQAISTSRDWLGSNYQDFIRRGFFQSRSLLKSESGKKIVSLGDQMITRAGVREGKASEAMRQAGVNRLSKKQRILMSDVLENTNKDGVVNISAVTAGEVTSEMQTTARELRKMLNEMVGEARGQGVQAGYLDNYLPRILTKKVSNIIYGDIRHQIRKIADLRPTSEATSGAALSDRVLSNRLKQQVANAKFNATTERAIKHMQEKTGMSRFKAISILERQSGDALYMPYGNLERSRSVDLPLDFYERDVKKIFDRYTEGWSRRVSEAEAFGASGEKAYALLDKISKTNPAEAVDARDIIQGLLRITEQTKAIENKSLAALANLYVNFRVGTAIGLGFSTIPNLTQTFISTYAKHGLIRTGRGLGELFTAEGRRAVRRSGSTWHDAHKMLIGTEARGPLSGFSKLTTTVFNVVNSGNKALAASTARVAIPEYWANAQGKGVLAKIGQTRLRHMGIDHTKPLTDDIVLGGMNRFANDSQLMRNVLNEPLWFNNPKLRPFILFKRFGYRQTTFSKDQMFKDFLIDPLPVLRLMAGGVAGGKFVIEARAAVKEFLGGEKRFNPERPLWEQGINVLAASGSIGVMTDLADAFDNDNWGAEVYSNVLFAVNPIIVDDMIKAFGPRGLVMWSLTSKDKQKLQGFTSKLIKSYGGSVSRYGLGQRLETRRQRKSRRSFTRRPNRGR